MPGNEETLLPCPFCGSAVTLTERDGLVRFTCPPESFCYGSRLYQCFPVEYSNRAIIAWNRRATPPAGA